MFFCEDVWLLKNLNGDIALRGDRAGQSWGIGDRRRIWEMRRRSSYGRFATNFEEFDEIVELAMDVAADCYRCLRSCYIILFSKDLFNLSEFLRVNKVK